MALTAPSSTLTGQTIAASYDQVLFLDAAAGVTEATLKIVSGTTGKTALSISDEHVLVKGVDTNNAAGFEVQQTDGTSILKVAAGTPAATLIGALTVGVDGTGHDVIFYGDSASSNMTWDEGEDDLVLNDARLYIDQDDDANALYIDSESTSTNAIIAYGNFTLQCIQDISGGYAGYFTRNIAEAGSNALVMIKDDHTSNTQPAFQIQQDGAGYGIFIDQNGNNNALYIDHDGATTAECIKIAGPTQTSGEIISLSALDALTTGAAMQVDCGSTALATTVSGGLVEILHDANSTSAVNNLLFVRNDHASATGTTGIYVQQDSTGPAISATGGIVEQGGVLKENLLTNSGFDVWSNSTLLEATGGAAPVLDGANSALTNNLITNGGFDSNVSGWASSVGAGDPCTLENVGSGKTGNCLRVTAVTGTATGASTSFTCVIGKLYQVTYHYNRGDIAALGSAIGTAPYPSTGYGTIHGYGEVPGATLTDVNFDEPVTVVFEATATTHYLTIFGTMGDTQVMYIDSVTAYEVTPGCVADNNQGPDGWWTTASGIDVVREHDGTRTKDGSFYSCKVTSAGGGELGWSGSTNDNTEPTWLAKVQGRTLTFGAWLWADAGSQTRIYIRDSVGGYTYSSWHDGGSDWDWHEVTATVASAATFAYVAVVGGGNAAYISQPMLVFGSSIGEGNYTRPQGEIVYLEDSENYMNSFNGNSFSDVSATTINLEAESDGQIPKGVQAVQWYVITRDSADTTALYFEIGGRYYGGAGNDVLKYAKTPFVACDVNGDRAYSINASGSSTTDVYLAPMAVQLR
jgi:hypothetical protein